MAVMTSPDLRTWSFPRTVIVPDELDISTMCVEGASAGFKWGSHFFAMVPISDHYGTQNFETQLAFSADGHHWNRLPDRPNYFERGPEGSWDSHWAMPTCPPVEMGDQWLRSEEHTSELQSLVNLVCRLLLEKKTKQQQQQQSRL